MSKQVNAFKKFNRFPFEHECRHAVKLIRLCQARKTDHYEACYDAISPPPDDLECEQVGNRMESIWNQELKQKGAAKANLVLVLFKCLFWDFLGTVLWSIISRVLLVLAILELLRQILISVEQFDQLNRLKLPSIGSLGNKTIKTNSNKTHSFSQNLLMVDDDLDLIYKRITTLAICLFLAVSSYLLFTATLKLLCSRCGLKCRICLMQLIQKKSLKLHLAASIEQSSAKTLSLVSNEVTFVEEANKYLVYIVTGPLSILTASLWLSITQTDWEPVALTFPFIVIIIMVQMYLPKLYKKTSRIRKEQTNKRIDIMNTFLNSIKIVKMYSWESRFRELVHEARESEMAQIKKLQMYTLFDLTIVNISYKVLPAIVILGHMLLFNQLNPRILFTTTAAYTFYRADSFLHFPRGLKAFSDLCTACKNIKLYLLSEELDDNRLKCPRGKKIILISENVRISFSKKALTKQNVNEQDAATKLPQAGCFKKIYEVLEDHILDGLDLKLEAGELAIICGQVGSGKSSLLLSLLGETRITGGLICVSDGARFAYAPQEPYVLAATLRDNILNGRPYDAERYSRVIYACSLEKDLGLLPDGDKTLVGSKGVSLSGGQKARLSLARTVYSKSDIYLLDDPLAAVDSKVAAHIFTECIKKFLSGKMVVLATHQLQFLSEANQVILLRKKFKPLVCTTTNMMNREEIQQILSQFKAAPKEDVDSNNHHQSTDGKLFSEADRNVNFQTVIEKSDTSCRLNASKTIENKGSAYLLLMKMGFSKCELILFFITLIVSCFFTTYSDYYFKSWADKVRKIELNQSSKQEHLKLLIYNWSIYIVIVTCYCLSLSMLQNRLASALLNSARNLHNQLVESLFNAKMIFYDFCQAGELGSRYAGDFAVIDHGLLFNAIVVVISSSAFLASLVCVALLNPFEMIPFMTVPIVCSPVAAFNYWKLRALMRLSKALRSPVYSNLAEPIGELATVRSDMDHLHTAKGRFNDSLNKLTTMSLLALMYESQLVITIRTLSLVMLGIMFYIMFGSFSNELKVSTTGTFMLLVVIAANSFPVLLEFGSSLETNMVSFESVRRYTQLEPEDDCDDRADTVSKLIEPSQIKTIQALASDMTNKREWLVGRISFKEVTMRYFKDERPALESLNFSIEGGERVGIVGRTGAGKSSIVSLVYRLYPFDGTITIDGVDIKTLKLAQLRGSLGVIPQDPVLFNDTLRKNLDPFEAYSDGQVWNALEVVNLRDFVAQSLQPAKLNHLISEGGRNFSVGQRQLVCLARAVLRAPKVLLIDEATANVDAETDAFIQRTIRSQFKSSTIITIAHRLNTVLDYDRVMVLETGRIVEFDSVEKLLKLDGGVFKSMLEQDGGTRRQTEAQPL